MPEEVEGRKPWQGEQEDEKSDVSTQHAKKQMMLWTSDHRVYQVTRITCLLCLRNISVLPERLVGHLLSIVQSCHV